MTTALNPSPWYRMLLTYKRGNTAAEAALTALAGRFLGEHRGAIEALLGGAPSPLTIVPSKRGIPFSRQPLRRVLERIPSLPAKLRHVLDFTGESLPRYTYLPASFEPTLSLEGERILLIEDTWVTGSTSVSAAGALLANGARSVLVVVFARDIDTGYWAKDHPYRKFLDERASRYDVSWWPR